MSDIILISAVSQNNVIGINNSLPWKLKDDLRLFKNLTQGHTVIMGRSSWESIGKPLPNRLNIVLSRDNNYEAEGCIVVPSLKDAINISHSKVFIVGGAQIYDLALPESTHFFRTRVLAEVQGDTYFPLIDESEWECFYSANYEKDADNDHAFVFEMLRRK